MATIDGAILNDRQTYGTEHLYPQELGSKRFPNMVKFYIHAKKITADKYRDSSTQFTASEKEMLGNENRSKAENYESIAKNSSAVVGFIAGYGLGKATSGDDVSKFMEVGKGLIGGTAARFVADAVTENQETVRLLDTISLYVPQSVVTAYTAQWDEVDLGPFAGTLGTGGALMADLQEAATGGAVEVFGRGAVAAAANIPSAAGFGDVDLGNLFEATSKKVGNPYKEQLFKSMGFRQFSFQYVFSPKNEKEHENVDRIIQLFKENMHPDVSEDGMFLIYPSEFRIEFHYSEDGESSQKNPHLPAISSCALKNVKLTYGPDGMLNTVRGTGGRPSEVTMELQFVELETLTRKRIKDSKPKGSKIGGF